MFCELGCAGFVRLTFLKLCAFSLAVCGLDVNLLCGRSDSDSVLQQEGRRLQTFMMSKQVAWLPHECFGVVQTKPTWFRLFKVSCPAKCLCCTLWQHARQLCNSLSTTRLICSHSIAGRLTPVYRTQRRWTMSSFSMPWGGCICQQLFLGAPNTHILKRYIRAEFSRLALSRKINLARPRV